MLHISRNKIRINYAILFGSSIFSMILLGKVYRMSFSKDATTIDPFPKNKLWLWLAMAVLEYFLPNKMSFDSIIFRRDQWWKKHRVNTYYYSKKTQINLLPYFNTLEISMPMFWIKIPTVSFRAGWSIFLSRNVLS